MALGRVVLVSWSCLGEEESWTGEGQKHLLLNPSGCLSACQSTIFGDILFWAPTPAPAPRWSISVPDPSLFTQQLASLGAHALNSSLISLLTSALLNTFSIYIFWSTFILCIMTPDYIFFWLVYHQNRKNFLYNILKSYCWSWVLSQKS